MHDFLTQGGFGAYVWPAYGISALALFFLGLWTVAAYRKAKAKLAVLESGDAP